MTQAVAERPEARTDQATARPAMVQATAVVKRYDTGKVQVRALRGVDLTITRGEMVAIMGPSGCGKTTLLNCLSGLDEIDEGEVQIEGVSLKAMSDVERTRYRTPHGVRFPVLQPAGCPDGRRECRDASPPRTGTVRRGAGASSPRLRDGGAAGPGQSTSRVPVRWRASARHNRTGAR